MFILCNQHLSLKCKLRSMVVFISKGVEYTPNYHTTEHCMFSECLYHCVSSSFQMLYSGVSKHRDNVLFLLYKHFLKNRMGHSISTKQSLCEPFLYTRLYVWYKLVNATIQVSSFSNIGLIKRKLSILVYSLTHRFQSHFHQCYLSTLLYI